MRDKKSILLFLFVLTFSSLFYPQPSFSDTVDGALNSEIGTDGYVEISNSLETNVELLKLEDGTFLQFGSRQRDPSLNTCLGAASNPSITKITSQGVVIDASFANSALTKLAPRDVAYFTAALQSSDRSIFLAGVTSDVETVVTSGGSGCNYPRRSSFIMKLNEAGFVVNEFGTEGMIIVDTLIGSTSSVSSVTAFVSLNVNSLVASVYGDSIADIVSINTSTGELNEEFGHGGKVNLANEAINVHKMIKTAQGIVLAGDKTNFTDAWFLRWAITEIDFNGNETLRFKGTNNYEYSNGYKEGIYVQPVYVAPYIYMVGGVLKDSTYDLKALRVHESGQVDSGYGGYLRESLATIGIQPCSYCSGKFAVDNYGRVLISTGTNSFFESGNRKSAIFRLTQKGLVDKDFGDSGKIIVDLESQAEVHSINVNDYLVFGNRYGATYCSFDGKTCGLYKNFLARFTQEAPTPIISKVELENGYLVLYLKLNYVLIDIGNWFYQVRTSSESCDNPYGENTTWNTNSLTPYIRVGKLIDGSAEGFDLSRPLTNGCTYQVNIAHWNGKVSSYVSISAVPGSPESITQAATIISKTEGLLKGRVKGKSLSTTSTFCHGTNPSLTDCTVVVPTENPLVEGSDEKEVSYLLTNLTPGVRYYYRISATNSAATTDGAILYFTPGASPIAETQESSSITSTSAVLSGTVNANGVTTSVEFCIGMLPDLSDCTLKSQSGYESVRGIDIVGLQLKVTDLLPESNYFYQVRARNQFGTSFGSTIKVLTLDEKTQRKLDEAIRKAEEKRILEEEQRLAEIKRQSAINEIRALPPTSPISLRVLVEAGVASAIEPILKQLDLFIRELDLEQRGNIAIIEKKAKELRREHFFTQLERQVDLKVLEELNFEQVSERVIPELQKFISTLDELNDGTAIVIQREITKINTLISGRDTGRLTEYQLLQLGVEFNLPTKKAEVLFRFRGLPVETFDNVESVKAKLLEIEQVIKGRLDRQAAARAKTQELRSRIKVKR